MKSKKPNKRVAAAVGTSDELHNKNCHKYLLKLKLPAPIPEDMESFKFIQMMQQDTHSAYDPTIAYGTMYTLVMEELEDALLEEHTLEGESFDQFFISMFENDNHILEETFEAVKGVIFEKTPSTAPVKGEIKSSLRDDKQARINLYTPAQKEETLSRTMDIVSAEYKPSHTTSLSTERRYTYNQDELSQELRFGTQGQVDNRFARVSPIFHRFLTAQARLNVDQQDDARKKITHIYFNNLGMHRKKASLNLKDVYEGWFESSLTRELHRLEAEHDNVVVITFPADKGLMSHHDVFHCDPTINRGQIKQLFLDIAMENPKAAAFIKDFYISEKARRLIFGSKEEEHDTLNTLLENSFEKLGLSDKKLLSEAQRQAVWVHFIKFELPNFILNQLDVNTYNFSCKDAIDRGGISSAYYNLMLSFETDTPMSREEFEQALQAAPSMVKGRGMNDHLDVLWNAVDQYMQANPGEIREENKQWLVEWRDANCPSKRAGELLDRRLGECISELKMLDTEASSQALDILKGIPTSTMSEAKHHALYLDAAVSTYALTVQPLSQAKRKKYDGLINRMNQVSAPTAGGMKKFLEWLKSVFSSQSSIEQEKKQGKQFEAVTNKLKNNALLRNQDQVRRKIHKVRTNDAQSQQSRHKIPSGPSRRS
ncbi:MAG: hypothetical protein NXI01_01090 [Gammaproteobacteria bacterium]|nr:hypothetical protein [Gammaproteobacteria bacterium]